MGLTFRPASPWLARRRGRRRRAANIPSSGAEADPDPAGPGHRHSQASRRRMSRRFVCFLSLMPAPRCRHVASTRETQSFAAAASWSSRVCIFRAIFRSWSHDETDLRYPSIPGLGTMKVSWCRGMSILDDSCFPSCDTYQGGFEMCLAYPGARWATAAR